MKTWNVYHYGSWIGQTVTARNRKAALREARRLYGSKVTVMLPPKNNPVRHVRKSTGWIKAKAVRIEKRGRQYVVKVKH